MKVFWVIVLTALMVSISAEPALADWVQFPAGVFYCEWGDDGYYYCWVDNLSGLPGAWVRVGDSWADKAIPSE